jgi:hypothetical protein
MNFISKSQSNPSDIHIETSSLLLFNSVFNDPVGENLIRLLKAIAHGHHKGSNNLSLLAPYGNWFRAIAGVNENWEDYFITQILINENPFTNLAQRDQLRNLPTPLIEGTKHDLKILQEIYELGQKMPTLLQEHLKDHQIIPWDIPPNPHNPPIYQRFKTASNWEHLMEDLGNYYYQNGQGIFAQYRGFSWVGDLQPVKYLDDIRLESLTGYEYQKEMLVKNTQFLLNGYQALNVLLYGSRGTGKSSLVKSLINHFHPSKLRIIEVTKAYLKDLPRIVHRISDLPQKFIIFVDDLSFEEDDDSFKALKVVLEGGIIKTPPNLVVYATSNRRHLVREYFGDRPRPSDADEITSWDTTQEKLSFSDRFGLTLTFESADQDTYLKIVKHLAKEAKIDLPSTDLEYRALQWATRHNGRSGRSAQQFINFLTAELAS